MKFIQFDTLSSGKGQAACDFSAPQSLKCYTQPTIPRNVLHQNRGRPIRVFNSQRRFLEIRAAGDWFMKGEGQMWLWK